MLKIYDVSIDEMRDVTQQDVDSLLCIRNAYGEIREKIKQDCYIGKKDADEIHEKLRKEIELR